MEAANIVFVPGFALYFGMPRDWLEAPAFGAAARATMGYLVVGTFYWRGVERRAQA